MSTNKKKSEGEANLAEQQKCLKDGQLHFASKGKREHQRSRLTAMLEFARAC